MNRSLIFVPAKEKMLSKISSMNADIFIIDLEDSIATNEKDIALSTVTAYLDGVENSKNIIIRLNKERYVEELTALHKYNVDFMLPKFECIEDYSEISNFSSNHSFYALVETPKGIVSISKIAQLEEISSIAFGAEDYTASVGMQNSIEYLIYQKSRLVTYAKAYGKKVYDTPSFKLDNEELFRAEVDNAYNLGFDGKMLITPRHLDYINRVFSDCDIESIKKIVDIYENQDQAVLVIDGKVYEKMHIAHLKKILKEKGEK